MRCDNSKPWLLLPTRTVPVLCTVPWGLLNFYRLTTVWLPVAAQRSQSQPSAEASASHIRPNETYRIVALLSTPTWCDWLNTYRREDVQAPCRGTSCRRESIHGFPLEMGWDVWLLCVVVTERCTLHDLESGKHTMATIITSLSWYCVL